MRNSTCKYSYWNLFLPLLVAALPLVAAVPGPAHARGLELESRLVRAPGAPDPDAKGEVEIESESDRGRFEFEVEAEQIDPSIEHRLYLEDAQGAMQFIAQMLPEDFDEVRYRARSQDGDPFPFGVGDPFELAGRAVEVYQVLQGQEVLLLVGNVPGGGAGNPSAKASMRDRLDATEAAPARAKAFIKMKTRSRDGDERFEVKAKRLDFSDSQEYRVFLEDPAQAGTLVDVGPLERRRDSTSARYRRRTKDGDALPLGVSSVRELVGLRIEVVETGSDTAIFRGTVPGPR